MEQGEQLVLPPPLLGALKHLVKFSITIMIGGHENPLLPTYTDKDYQESKSVSSYDELHPKQILAHLRTKYKGNKTFSKLLAAKRSHNILVHPGWENLNQWGIWASRVLGDKSPGKTNPSDAIYCLKVVDPLTTEENILGINLNLFPLSANCPSLSDIYLLEDSIILGEANLDGTVDFASPHNQKRLALAVVSEGHTRLDNAAPRIHSINFDMKHKGETIDTVSDTTEFQDLPTLYVSVRRDDDEAHSFLQELAQDRKFNIKRAREGYASLARYTLSFENICTMKSVFALLQTPRFLVMKSSSFYASQDISSPGTAVATIQLGEKRPDFFKLNNALLLEEVRPMGPRTARIKIAYPLEGLLNDINEMHQSEAQAVVQTRITWIHSQNRTLHLGTRNTYSDNKVRGTWKQHTQYSSPSSQHLKIEGLDFATPPRMIRDLLDALQIVPNSDPEWIAPANQPTRAVLRVETTGTEEPPSNPIKVGSIPGTSYISVLPWTGSPGFLVGKIPKKKGPPALMTDTINLEPGNVPGQSELGKSDHRIKKTRKDLIAGSHPQTQLARIFLGSSANKQNKVSPRTSKKRKPTEGREPTLDKEDLGSSPMEDQ